ncbi:MAG: tetratricopeptide repeat protein [Muribaculaceae bacterium]|nr:tetratricopeptide repeat protein [Muribaculaceae bacterium]
MKKILIILTIIAGAFGVKGATLPEMADSAYNELAYSEALNLYEATLDSLGGSADLYYNLGNTYYRLQQPGKAILWYERAIKADPTHSDARANLEFVNTTITDKPIDNRSLIKRKYDRLVDSANGDTWAWIAAAFFAFAVAGAVVYLISSDVTVRKVCFFGGLGALGLSIVILVIAATGASRASNHDYAIVISPAANLSTSPRASSDASTQAFLLHEGTKVQLVDSLIKGNAPADCWYEVSIGGDARAWINGEDIERI